LCAHTCRKRCIDSHIYMCTPASLLLTYGACALGHPFWLPSNCPGVCTYWCMYVCTFRVILFWLPSSCSDRARTCMYVLTHVHMHVYCVYDVCTSWMCARTYIQKFLAPHSDIVHISRIYMHAYIHILHTCIHVYILRPASCRFEIQSIAEVRFLSACTHYYGTYAGVLLPTYTTAQKCVYACTRMHI
jgi:hypothetical protein